MILSAGNRAA